MKNLKRELKSPFNLIPIILLSCIMLSTLITSCSPSEKQRKASALGKKLYHMMHNLEHGDKFPRTMKRNFDVKRSDPEGTTYEYRQAYDADGKKSCICGCSIVIYKVVVDSNGIVYRTEIIE